jgi:hypothetical protein
MAGKKIILKLVIFLAFLSPALQAQFLSISGKITDTSGEPVVDASPKINISNHGT